MSLGPYRDIGGAIHLTRGASGKPWHHAEPGEWLAIAKGVEDSLSFAVLRPEIRVAALATSLAYLAHVRLPSQCAGVIVIQQNDPLGSDADSATKRDMAALQARGIAVWQVSPPPGVKYLNDLPQFARAFFLDGCPNDLPALGSFPEWSKWVRDPLIWLDEAESSRVSGRGAQGRPAARALSAVLYQWDSVFSSEPVSLRKMIEIAGQSGCEGYHHPDLREALMAVSDDGKGLNVQRLGNWLARNKGRSVDGMRIEPAPTLRGIARWQLLKR